MIAVILNVLNIGRLYVIL